MRALNGQEIVRVMGKGLIWEFVILLPETEKDSAVDVMSGREVLALELKDDNKYLVKYGKIVCVLITSGFFFQSPTHTSINRITFHLARHDQKIRASHSKENVLQICTQRQGPRAGYTEQCRTSSLSSLFIKSTDTG